MTVGRYATAGSLALIVLLILASSATVASGTETTIRPSDAAASTAQNATATARLTPTIVHVRQGETATLRVALEGTESATIVLGDDESGYNVTIAITDEDRDGTVPLEFRTGAVGMEATRFVPADDADGYGTLNAAPDPDGTVPVGEYPIAIYLGRGAGGEPVDVGTLVVAEPAPPPNASIDRTGSGLTLHPRSGQVVAGTADLDPGRTVAVRLRSTAESPFLKSRETAVGEDGTFSARFDLSGIDPPANATVTVSVDGRRIAGPVEVAIVARPSSTSGPPWLGVLAVVAALLGVVAAGRYLWS